MRITKVEIDDNNVGHVTRHGVPVEEIEAAFDGSAVVRRNKGGRAADYFIVANGVRVNFVYRGGGVARPISAWRV